MARIFITRTPNEWGNLSKQSFRSGTPALVRRSIQAFVEDLEKNPDKIKEIECRRFKKTFYLPEEQFSELQKLSIRLKIPVCTIVDELIIAPLLLSK